MSQPDANTIIECPECGAEFRYWEGYNAGIGADLRSIRVCSHLCVRARLPAVAMQLLHSEPEPVAPIYTDGDNQLMVHIDITPDSV